MDEEVLTCFGTEQSDFHLQHIRRYQPFGVTNHYHNTYEIYYLFKGSRIYFIKDRSYLVSPGNLVLINKNDVHKTSNIDVPGHERVLIHFSEQFLNEPHGLASAPLLQPFLMGNPLLELNYQERAFIEGLLHKLCKELTCAQSGYELYVKLLLTELLLFVARRAAKSKTAAVTNVSMIHSKISDIAQYINTHFQSKICLNSLAEQFYISPSYLSRSFKQVTGFTFVEYLNVIRIKEAQKLIENTNTPITEIAALAGFEYLTHFERTFKKWMKITPMQYKKTVRGGNVPKK